MLEKTKPYWEHAIFVGVFLLALLHLYIPIINHLNYKTFAYDYGVYNFAFYDFAHFRVSPCPVYLAPYSITFLQDHFSLTLVILSPLYWILAPLFGTYTLLLLQWALIMFGAWATYRFILYKSDNKLLALTATLYYLILYARFASYFSDCNLAIMGSALVPVFLFFYETKKRIPLILTFIFLITNREDFSLGLFFLCLMLLVLNRKDKEQRSLALIMGCISLVAFITIFKCLIPMLETNEMKFSLFNYSTLGASPTEALFYVFSHPIEVVKMLFVNHTNKAEGDGIKLQFYAVYLISGGFILFYRPVFLIALIPLIAKKMFNDTISRWGIDLYQSVEIATILPALVFYVIAEFNSKIFKTTISFVVIIFTAFTTYYCLRGSTTRAFGLNKIDFFSEGFSRSEFNLKDVKRMCDKIPTNASACVSGGILPHLAFRDQIYHFPYFEHADYAFVCKKVYPFPVSREEYVKALENLKVSEKWQLIDETSDFVLFKRVLPEH